MSLLWRGIRSPQDLLVGATLKISRYGHDAACRLRKPRQIELLIYDDFFPDVLTAFRVAEYNHYLESFPTAEVHSTRPCNFFFSSRGSYQEKHIEYARYYPHLSGRVKRFNRNNFPQCKLAYTVFLNNAYQLLPHLEKHAIPFVFTLYPGGGFCLDNPEQDRKLKRVLSSPLLKKVFTTQKVTSRYLVEKGLCAPNLIEFIYGCVLPSGQLAETPARKLRFKEDKATFDICFVAMKYTERGVDKGYDLFIEVAHKLSCRFEDVRFHVVGGFTADDIDVSAIREKITFYGLRNTDFFPSFYSGMEMIVSPNRMSQLAPGAFDGFPTGACTEAGLCGVAVVCSDPLNLNVAFADEEEIVIVPSETDEIVRAITRYYTDPSLLYELAEKGKKAFEQVYATDAQMEGRMRVLKDLLAVTDSREWTDREGETI